MLSCKKGIVLNRVIGLIISMAMIFVAITLTVQIGGDASKSADQDCLIYNSFKNIAGDWSANTLGGGSCRPKTVDIGPPDFSGSIYEKCSAIMPDPNNYQKSIDQAFEYPDDFVEQCIAYQVMEQVEKCWANYLMGKAQYDATCSTFCLANGYSSYYIEGRSNSITLPKILDSEIYYYRGDFDKQELTGTLIRELIPITDSKLNQYFESKTITLNEEGTTISTVRKLTAPKFSIVMSIPTKVGTKSLSNAAAVINSNEERSGINYDKVVIGKSDTLLETGEKWQIDYSESSDFPLAAATGGVVGFMTGGVKWAVIGASVGQVGESAGTWDIDIELEPSAVGIISTGYC